MIEYNEVASTPAPAADLRDAYGTGPLQFGELRLPRGETGRRPVIVLIHGGCWQAAYNLAHIAPAAAALAAAGYAVWVPEYRRVGDAGGGWPGTFEDVALAVDHVRELASRVPAIDTSRVLLAGHSAGGQLALWAASRRAGQSGSGAGPSSSSKAPLPAAGVVSLAGITDLATYGDGSGSCNNAVTPLMGGTPAQVAERYRAVSPLELVPIGVPAHLVHGAEDPIVPSASSERYAERARASGDRVTVTIVKGAGHFDVIAPQASAWSAVLDALRALAAPTPRR
jgi:acetyl esterase/lipase